MRTVLAKITDPKSGVKLKLNPIGTCSKFSNKVLMILVVQGAAKLPKVKVGGLKKILLLGLIPTTPMQPAFQSWIFLGLRSLTFSSFSPL